VLAPNPIGGDLQAQRPVARLEEQALAAPRSSLMLRTIWGSAAAVSAAPADQFCKSVVQTGRDFRHRRRCSVACSCGSGPPDASGTSPFWGSDKVDQEFR
jgi:hypothetical protein